MYMLFTLITSLTFYKQSFTNNNDAELLCHFLDKFNMRNLIVAMKIMMANQA